MPYLDRSRNPATARPTVVNAVDGTHVVGTQADGRRDNRPRGHRLADVGAVPVQGVRLTYTNALWSIGAQKGFDAWTQDGNHRLSVLLPWGIAFVHGGNHSIAAGILAGEGTLLAEEVLDATSLLDLVSCDGQHYRSKSTGKAIARVQDHRRAAVFEIGRLILERE